MIMVVSNWDLCVVVQVSLIANLYILSGLASELLMSMVVSSWGLDFQGRVLTMAKSLYTLWSYRICTSAITNVRLFPERFFILESMTNSLYRNGFSSTSPFLSPQAEPIKVTHIEVSYMLLELP